MGTAGKTPASQARVATQIVAEIAAKLPGDGPHSLCEVHLSEDRYQLLCRWVAEKLRRSTVHVSGWQVGAILFDVIIETARREAEGHRLWPIVVEKFPPYLRRELFVDHHPNAELKNLIRQAARRLNLRHVFDEDEVQSWYITTHLQFGFTYHGMRERLPEWLCGQNPPVSVKRLLVGSLASDSFRDLWEALRYYRRDWITEGHLRSIIKQSPWVLPAWENDLVRLARERPELVDIEDECETSDGSTIAVLTSPRCEWHLHDALSFSCAVGPLERLTLRAPHYDLRHGETTLASVFRQPKGDYRADATVVTLRTHASQAVVKLRDNEGFEHVTQVVELWDPSADLNVFELRSGRRLLDAATETMSDKMDYVLLVQPDLKVLPEPAAWVRLGGIQRQLAALISSPWDADVLRVETSDRAVVWRPYTGAGAQKPTEPSWLKNIVVQTECRGRIVRLGQVVRPVIRGLPEGATLVFARLGGRALDFNRQTGSLQAVTIDPELAQCGFMFSLGVMAPPETEMHGIFHIRRRLELGVTGLGALGDDGWQCVSPSLPLTAQACREKAFRVYFPPDAEVQKAALMEGPFFLRWIGQRTAPLGRVLGIGAPLVVRNQPYNCPAELVKLASGVTHGGIIQELNADARECTSWELTLSHPMQPSPEHRVVCWPIGSDGELTVIDYDHITARCDGCSWTVASPCANNGPGTIAAICFKGRWLGVTWYGDLVDFFDMLETLPENRFLVASLVRWFQLPVLLRDRSEDTPAFCHFAHLYPEAVLASWLNHEGLPEALLHNEGFERRQIEATELRELFLAWTPTEEQTQLVVGELGKTNDCDPLGETVLKLLLDDPLLTGHLMLHWLRSRGTPQRMPLEFYMQVLRQQLSPRLPGAGGKCPPTDEFLTLAAQTMRVGPKAVADDYFVRGAVAEPAISTLRGGTLTPEVERNLGVALQVASFRQYLALRVLDEVDRQLTEQ